MKTPRLLIVGLCAFAALLSFNACTSSNIKLDPAGPYHGDVFLFQTDMAITGSYSVFDTFVTWEYTNRALLAGNPAPTKLADSIRANAKQWFGSAEALREAYAASPTPQNKASLQKVLAIIQAALIEATTYMAIPPPASPAK